MSDVLIACPGCDRLHADRRLEPGERARCVRCGDLLRTRKPHTVDRSLAASVAALVLLGTSLSLPFLALSRGGLGSEISVIDAVIALWAYDMRLLGLVTLAAIAIVPALRFGLLVWVLGGLRLGRRRTDLDRAAFRLALRLEPWAMAEIFMIGVVVSLVKIGEVARLEVGPAFWSLLGLVVMSLIVSLVLCPSTVWRLLDRRR